MKGGATRMWRTFAAAFLAAAASWATGPTAVVDQPVRDAGRVVRGEPVRYLFQISNDGDMPLEVVEVRSTCGCTITEAPEAIGPGGSGRVRVVLDTAALAGPLARSVEILTNDPRNPILQLTVKADVRQPVRIQPDYIRFRRIAGDGPQRAGATLAAADGGSFTARSVESPWPFVRAELRPATEEERVPDVAGAQWRVDVTLAAEAPAGPFAGHLVVLTDLSERPRLEIPVSGLVRPTLEAVPATVDWGRKPARERLEAAVEITNLGEVPVELIGAAGDLPGLETEIRVLEEGERWRVRLTLPPGVPGRLDGTLRVETTSERQPVVEARVLVIRE